MLVGKSKGEILKAETLQGCKRAGDGKPKYGRTPPCIYTRLQTGAYLGADMGAGE